MSCVLTGSPRPPDDLALLGQRRLLGDLVVVRVQVARRSWRSPRPWRCATDPCRCGRVRCRRHRRPAWSCSGRRASWSASSRPPWPARCSARRRRRGRPGRRPCPSPALVTKKVMLLCCACTAAAAPRASDGRRQGYRNARRSSHCVPPNVPDRRPASVGRRPDVLTTQTRRRIPAGPRHPTLSRRATPVRVATKP